MNVKEAITDLYLAIKIRSCEELDRINEDNLKEEKLKMMQNQNCFQILEYIRSSIEIIMNLKIEDLEKNDNNKNKNNNQMQETSLSTARKNSGFDLNKMKDIDDISISKISIESKNLIL